MWVGATPLPCGSRLDVVSLSTSTTLGWIPSPGREVPPSSIVDRAPSLSCSLEDKPRIAKGEKRRVWRSKTASSSWRCDDFSFGCLGIEASITNSWYKRRLVFSLLYRRGERL